MTQTHEFLNRERERLTNIDTALSHMRARMDTRRQETAAHIDEWKHERKVDELEAQALDAEGYAEATKRLLELAQDEAWAASQEAIEARRVANEAKQKV